MHTVGTAHSGNGIAVHTVKLADKSFTARTALGLPSEVHCAHNGTGRAGFHCAHSGTGRAGNGNPLVCTVEP